MHYTIWFIVLFLINAVMPENCTDELFNAYDLMSEINMSILSEGDVRYVSENGSDIGDCSDSDNPCKTLLYASSAGDWSTFNITSLKIKIYPGEYNLVDQFVSFHESRNIMLEGTESSNTIIRCGNTPPPANTCIFENVAFYNSANIWIKNITFDGCGPDPSAHFIFNSTNIILENNVYQNNTAPAVIAYLSSPLYILNSHFKDNIVGNVSNVSCLTSSGLFYRDNVTSAGGISIFGENHTQEVLLFDCYFGNNFGRRNNESNSVPSQLKQFGHGGGLSVRLVNSDDGYVCVVNSSFNNNAAEVEGGAIIFTIADSDNNNITLSKVTFHKNYCCTEKCTGGAVNVDLFAPAKQNRINFFECDFSHNNATLGSGGAISIAGSDKGFSDNGSDAYALVTIDSCNFKHNTAKFEGTAVGLFFLGRVNQAGFRIRMKDW